MKRRMTHKRVLVLYDAMVERYGVGYARSYAGSIRRAKLERAILVARYGRRMQHVPAYKVVDGVLWTVDQYFTTKTRGQVIAYVPARGTWGKVCQLSARLTPSNRPVFTATDV